jgi:HKD family nuclease
MATVTFIRVDPGDGSTALHHVINGYLNDQSLIRARFVVAYARWSGLTLIAKPLERFLERDGKLDLLFGYDNGVTTPDALHYAYSLRQRFGSAVFAGAIRWDYSNSLFHPKCFVFETAKQSNILVGSANLTKGGFHANHELCVQFSAPTTSPDISAYQAAWKHYRKLAVSVEPELIRELERSAQLSSESKRENDTKALPPFDLPRMVGAGPLYKHLQGSAKPVLRRKLLEEADTLSQKPRRLYQEVLVETGPDGTQLQFPRAAAGAFFGLAPDEARDATFLFASGEVNVRIAHYPNKTNRIPLRTLAGVPRPAIIVFARVGKDRYRCRIIRNTEPAYRSIRRDKCTEQTSRRSRRWGLG